MTEHVRAQRGRRPHAQDGASGVPLACDALTLAFQPPGRWEEFRPRSQSENVSEWPSHCPRLPSAAVPLYDALWRRPSKPLLTHFSGVKSMTWRWPLEPF